MIKSQFLELRRELVKPEKSSWHSHNIKSHFTSRGRKSLCIEPVRIGWSNVRSNFMIQCGTKLIIFAQWIIPQNLCASSLFIKCFVKLYIYKWAVLAAAWTQKKNITFIYYANTSATKASSLFSSVKSSSFLFAWELKQLERWC